MKGARTAPAATSVVIHVVVAAAVLRWYTLGYPMPDFFEHTHPVPKQETIRFVRTGVGSTNGVTRLAQGGARKAGKPAEEKRLIAPVDVPTGLAAAPPAVDVGGANGETAGAGAGGDGSSGVLDGMRPQLSDGRVYVIPRGLTGPPELNSKQRVDSVIGDRFARYRDSIAEVQIAHAGDRQPGDWTVKTKDGKKWGIDPQFIRLGNFSIPTTLLALLPLNVQGNGPHYYESRRIAALSSEIRDQALQLKNDDDFSSAVKRIRERKDKERAASQQLRRQREDVAPATVPVPVTQPR